VTEQQDATTYSQLLDAVRASGLGWVADQVEAEVAAGRLEAVQVTPVREEPGLQITFPSAPGFRSQRGPKTEYLKSSPYSGTERARLLLDAIEQAVLRTIQMQGVAVSIFSERLGSSTFILAAPNQASDGVVVSMPDKTQIESMASLEAALGRLRNLIGT